MAYRFRPAVVRHDQLAYFPRPVTALRVQDGWDFRSLKVLLQDGDVTVGHSRNGVDVLIEGQVGSRDGTLTVSEEAMFAEVERLRTLLDVTSDDDKFALYLFYDDAADAWRHFSSCSTVRFESDLSHPSLYTWSAVIHADDPTLHTSGSAG